MAFNNPLRNDQNFWNFIFVLVFIAILIAFTSLLGVNQYHQLQIPPFDFLVLGLAIFRTIRLFSYDKITQFLRDFLYDLEYMTGDDGESRLVKIKPESGPRRTILELLDCPWCTGVWASLFILFFYYYTPLSQLPVLILAVSGLASFIQLWANSVGWRAEHLKLEAMNHSSKGKK